MPSSHLYDMESDNYRVTCRDSPCHQVQTHKCVYEGRHHLGTLQRLTLHSLRYKFTFYFYYYFILFTQFIPFTWLLLHHKEYVHIYIHLSFYLVFLVFLVEEADVKDDQGNITKELYVLQAAPLESHAGYRLETEDPAVFSDGGKMTLMAGYVLVLGLTYQFPPGGEHLHLLLVGAPLICQLNRLVVVHTLN